jgi:TRAP-type C4-dicarboxylate transport system substrate-binding protein
VRRILLFALIIVVALGFIVEGCPAPASTPTPSGSTPEQTLTPTAAQPIVLTFATHEPPSMMTVEQIIDPVLDEIESRSGGRVKIERYYAESLVSLPDTYNAVKEGVVDIAHGMQGLVPGQFPMDEVMNYIPYDKRDWRMSSVWWELYQQFPEFQAEYKDVKLLWPACYPWAIIGTTKKPIRTLEDNVGMKMAVGAEAVAIRGEALGWTPIPVPPMDLYSSLEKGVVDGAGTFEMDTLWAFGWGEVLKYITVVPVNQLPMFVVMNLDTWNSLPPDIQEIIDDCTGLKAAELNDRVRWNIEMEYLPQVEEKFGITTIYLSDEELARWVQADQVAVNRYIASLDEKGLPGEEFFTAYLNLVDKYSAPEYEVKAPE